MIVIKREDQITPDELLKGINEMCYQKRRYILANIKLDTELHKNKVLMYNAVNQINEYSLTLEQRAILLTFYRQQIKFLQELN